jgi:hypothetical protein
MRKLSADNQTLSAARFSKIRNSRASAILFTSDRTALTHLNRIGPAPVWRMRRRVQKSNGSLIVCAIRHCEGSIATTLRRDLDATAMAHGDFERE